MPNEYKIDDNLKEEEKNENESKPQPSSIGKSRKIAVASLAFFAVLVIGMWMMQFKKSINEPFAYKAGNNVNNTIGGLVSDEELRNKDTDGDGLSDWDELNLYNTSPYLEDSDSDGFTDKKEIDSDNDPNCPTGRDCYSSEILDGQQQETNQDIDSLDLLNELNTGGQINANDQNTPEGNLSQEGNQEDAIKNILGGQGNAALLRQMLIQSGMDENTLSQISDEELMNSYQEVLGE